MPVKSKNLPPKAIFPAPTIPNSKRVWFQPMGFSLQLISNSPAILDAAYTSFAEFGPAQPDESPDFIFRLFHHDLDDGQPKEPVFRLDGSMFYQTIGRDSTLVANLAEGVAFGHFSTTTLANQAYFRWHFLELAFFMMLEARGFMGVHGAALVKNNQALFLRAQSGGGKTTLAYAGARSRYQALAEDVVWLDGNQVLWWGMPWSFHLLPDAKTLFPELAPFEPILQTNNERKLEVNLEHIRSGSTTVSAKPKAIIFVERLAGGESRLEALDSRQAQALWPIGRTGLEMKLPHHAAHIEQLLTANPSYRFYFGDDIDQGLALLDPLFD